MICACIKNPMTKAIGSRRGPWALVGLVAALWLATSVVAMAATEERLAKSFAVAPGGALVVDVDFGSIEVTGTTGGEMTASVWRRVERSDKADEEAFLKDRPVTFEQTADGVTIRSRRQSKGNWSMGWHRRTDAKYVIRVPERFNLQLNADGGAVTVTGCEGTIKISSSGGRIVVTGCGGDLKANTSGGSVSVKRFRGPARVRTSGGGITMENIGGAIEGSTSGGAINATLLSPVPGDVKLDTSGGGVTVRVAASAAFNLDAATSGGGASCDLPIAAEGKKGGSRRKGAVNGGGPAVRLRSSGGGIHVKAL